MRVEHVALCVRDLEAMRDFYVAHLGATAGELYHNPRTGLRTYFLTFDGGARIELMQRLDALPGDAALREGWAHLCFAVESRAAVDAATARLRAAGCTLESGPRVTGDAESETVTYIPDTQEEAGAACLKLLTHLKAIQLGKVKDEFNWRFLVSEADGKVAGAEKKNGNGAEQTVDQLD